MIEVKPGDRVVVNTYVRKDGKAHPVEFQAIVMKVGTEMIDVLPDGTQEIKSYWPPQIKRVIEHNVS